MSDADEIRVGDRYTHGDRRITITKIVDDWIEFSAMGADGSIWADKIHPPLPSWWVRAGRGPEMVVLCGFCKIAEVEYGQVYCWTCLAVNAPMWASLTEDEAAAKTRRLAEQVTFKVEPATGSPGTGRVGQQEEENDGGEGG